MSKNKNGKPLLKVYAELAAKRYMQMGKKEKSKYLKELAADCQVTSQHVRRVMSELARGKQKKLSLPSSKRGRKPVYKDDDQVIWWLQTFWVGTNYPNTKLMPVMLKEWLGHFKEEGFTEEIRLKILSMSTSTMERLLKSYKKETGKKHFAATRGKGRLKKLMIRIPERHLNFKINVSGYLEGDTVAHCGDTLRGKHGWTLNTVCIHSAWTESEVFLGKDEERIVESMILMRSRFPFPVKGFHSDCGSEFMNDTLATYLEDEKNYVVQTHGRAYRKNDQARVEQRNWTHVRQSFGYDRVETQSVVECMNDIYRNELRTLRNFFTPTQKQKSKIRVGSKYKRKFETPMTPFDRVMLDPSVSEEIKKNLRAEKATYNPFEIKKRLDEKLKFFEKLLQNQKGPTDPKTSADNTDHKEAA